MQSSLISFLSKLSALGRIKKDVLFLILVQALIFILGIIFLNIILLLGIMFSILLVISIMMFLWNMNHPSHHKWISPALLVTIIILTFGMIIMLKGYTGTTLPKADQFTKSGAYQGMITRFDDSATTKALLQAGQFYSPYRDDEVFNSSYYIQVSPYALKGSTIKIHLDFLISVKPDSTGTVVGFDQAGSTFIDDPANNSFTYHDVSMTARPKQTFSFNFQTYTVPVWAGSVDSPTYTVNTPYNITNDYYWFNFKGHVESGWGNSTNEQFLILGFNTTISINGTAYPNQYISDAGMIQNTISMSATEAALNQWVLIGMTILSIWLMALFASMITGKMDLVMMVVLVLLMFSILAMMVMISIELNEKWVSTLSSLGLDMIAQALAIAIGVVKWCISVGLFTAICLVVTIFYMKARMK